MEFRDVINNRRSTREFTDQKIEKWKIDDLIDCARLSPSAANRQNWFFVIAEGDTKNEIANIMSSQLNTEEKIDPIDDPTKPYRANSSLVGSIKVINQAPILIIAFRKPDDNWKEGDYLSIGSAIEHISLRATDLGLGSLWLRDVIYTNNEIEHFLNMDDMELVASIAVGYSNEYPYDRKKKNLDDIMKYL